MQSSAQYKSFFFAFLKIRGIIAHDKNNYAHDADNDAYASPVYPPKYKSRVTLGSGKKKSLQQLVILLIPHPESNHLTRKQESPFLFRKVLIFRLKISLYGKINSAVRLKEKSIR